MDASWAWRTGDDEQSRIVATLQQRAIDREIGATRRFLLAGLRGRLRSDPKALCAEEFLAVADAPVVLDAIMLAAVVVGAADAGDLHRPDPDTGTLRLTRQLGLPSELVSYLANLGPGQPTAYTTAAATGEPVIIDDVTRSPLLARRPIVDVLLAAGCPAVQSYPLHHDDGRLLAVLSLRYRMTRPRRGNPELVAWCAARALTSLAG